MDNLRIKGPRQQRAIAALLEGPVAVKDLGPKIGALNQRQVISELRSPSQGFLGIIKTRRFTVTDQDGKRCRPGEYYIPQDVKPIVEKSLTESIIQTRARRSEAAKNSNTSDDSRRK